MPTQQISIDPATGAQARKEVMVNVVCDENLNKIEGQFVATAYTALERISDLIKDDQIKIKTASDTVIFTKNNALHSQAAHFCLFNRQKCVVDRAQP